MDNEEGIITQQRERQRRLNPPIDLRLLDYVSEYDENLACPICRCPFIEPVALTDCDHHFCTDCVRQCWNSSPTYTTLQPRGNCPTCRAPAKLSAGAATSKLIVNIVGELLVHCPYSESGCAAQIRRGEIQDHVDLYCGYGLVECPGEHCELEVRRKDRSRGCLHWPVSCLSCRAEVQMSTLEEHWVSKCPDRSSRCKKCKMMVLHREVEDHERNFCQAHFTTCAGQFAGCNFSSNLEMLEAHMEDCVFVRLAPVLQTQQTQLTEQRLAQTQLNRRLEVLQDGFAVMEDILRRGRTTDRRKRRLSPTYNESLATLAAATEPDGTLHDLIIDQEEDISSGNFSILGNDATLPPPFTDGGPYASPLHHLLSMHEALRDELQRISATLSELDGRHSMQTLNENVRTREEISYLGAQVGGLQRQVHWLTSAELQRQHSRGAIAGPSSGGAGSVEGVVGAVNSAATALRGAARAVGVGSSQDLPRDGLRRGTSEEGRTKL